ncbi:PPOX class F420-dependent oxidoreductase [Angustibacter sp. McL0619]|uniref:PPOX class F420-dependent oxidoreductase n=1 Tax=Angustibacter sp. McL0619 TaxID=3415676 RepID=UPI003CEEDA1F
MDQPNAQLALLAQLRRGVLTTLKRDGRAQLSVVSYHCDPATALVRISTRSPLAKTANARRDPRVSLLATTEHLRPYVVAEGDAEVGPVAQQPDDAVVEELVEHYRTLNGEHPDWAEFRAAMVAEQRLVLRFTVTRTYGLPVG